MPRMKKPDQSWQERAKQVLAQRSPGTNSKRPEQYVQGVYPTHVVSGSGSKLTDAWGNEYIDFISALGAITLGYAHPKVTEAAVRQAQKGASFSLPSTLEVEVAEILCTFVPHIDRVRFLKNGRDAADAAVRIARTYTNRKMVYTDGYHGCSDLFTSLTQPALGVVDMFHVKQLTDDADLSDAACVIVEALKLSDDKDYQAWIRALREKCRASGTVFILDEIITGFRYPSWTVGHEWRLDPDIVLLGKGVANGYPLSVVGGKKAIMDCAEYFISTTFSGEAVSLAAAKATIQELNRRNFNDLLFYGKRLQTKLNSLHPEIKFEGYGTRAMLNTTNETTALFMQEMCHAGYLLGKAHFFHFAHLEENVEPLFLDAATVVADRIRQGEVKLEGERPRNTFKR